MATSKRDRDDERAERTLAVDEYMKKPVTDRLRDAYLIAHPEIDEDKSFE